MLMFQEQIVEWISNMGYKCAECRKVRLGARVLIVGSMLGPDVVTQILKYARSVKPILLHSLLNIGYLIFF